MDDDVRRYIEDRIAAYREENPDQAEFEGDYCAKHHALPLYRGWTATIGLKPDGTMIEWSTDEDPPYVKPVIDSRECRIFLVQGCKRFPGLQPLVPQRSPSAVDCPMCNGTGVVKLEGRVVDVVCYCGGLGWLEAREEHTIPRG